MWREISSLFFFSLLCWWFRAEMIWIVLCQKRCWADLKQKEKSKSLFQVSLWFSWTKAQSCQLMVWSSVPQCIVLSYSSSSWVMEDLKINPPHFSVSFVITKKMYETWPQCTLRTEELEGNGLKVGSDCKVRKRLTHSPCLKTKEKWVFSIPTQTLNNTKEVPVLVT